MSIKQHVIGEVTFQYYRSGMLYYSTSTGMLFPVPVEETGDATFSSRDKGMFFMRWIRKHLEAVESGKEEMLDYTAANKYLDKIH